VSVREIIAANLVATATKALASATATNAGIPPFAATPNARNPQPGQNLRVARKNCQLARSQQQPHRNRGRRANQNLLNRPACAVPSLKTTRASSSAPVKKIG
jgi:hypothetical protein